MTTRRVVWGGEEPPARERTPAGCELGSRGDEFAAFARQRYEAHADLAALADHPRNPRRGDDEAVAGSIDANGFYGAILAQQSTGLILAGHTRRRVLMSRGQTRGPVLWLDVDDTAAERILLADNRTAELATWDHDALLALLSGLGEDDLAGTAFTADDLLVLGAGLDVERRDTGGGPGGGVAGDDEGPEPSALWPLLSFRLPHGLLNRFRALPGGDDRERLEGLLG